MENNAKLNYYDIFADSPLCLKEKEKLNFLPIQVQIHLKQDLISKSGINERLISRIAFIDVKIL